MRGLLGGHRTPPSYDEEQQLNCNYYYITLDLLWCDARTHDLSLEEPCVCV